jgi:hypothetical protein
MERIKVMMMMKVRVLLSLRDSTFYLENHVEGLFRLNVDAFLVTVFFCYL